KKCHSRVRQHLWCPHCEKELSRAEIVRGFEYAKGQYVVVSDKELEDLPVPSKHTIDLTSFVKAEGLEQTFHEKSYFVEPGEGGAKPYALLRKALEKKQLTGVASIALRNRERLCAVRVEEGGLVLDTLFYADELRKRPSVADVRVTERELGLAFNL